MMKIKFSQFCICDYTEPKISYKQTISIPKNRIVFADDISFEPIILSRPPEKLNYSTPTNARSVFV